MLNKSVVFVILSLLVISNVNSFDEETVILDHSLVNLNPGGFVYAGAGLVPRIKEKFYTYLHDEILGKTFKIDEIIQKKHLKVYDIEYSLNVASNDISLTMNEANNSISIDINNINIYGKGHWKAKWKLIRSSGDIRIKGKVAGVHLVTQLQSKSTTDKGQDIPYFNIQSFDVQLHGDDQKVNIHGSILKVLNPLINCSILGIKNLIVRKVKHVIGRYKIGKKLGDLINKGIQKSAPGTIPIREFGISVSSYLQGQPKIYNTGIEIPIDGIVFATKNGYNNNYNCQALVNPINHSASLENDLEAVLGECAIKSLVDGLVDSGFTRTIDISEKTEGQVKDITMSLTKWDKTGFDFEPGVITARIGIQIITQVLDIDMKLIADVTGKVTLVRRTQTPSPLLLSTAPRPTNSKGTLSTWNVTLKIEDLDNVKMESNKIDDRNKENVQELILTFLKNQELTTPVAIPQICLLGNSCMKDANFEVAKGYVKVKFTMDV